MIVNLRTSLHLVLETLEEKSFGDFGDKTKDAIEVFTTKNWVVRR